MNNLDIILPISGGTIIGGRGRRIIKKKEMRAWKKWLSEFPLKLSWLDDIRDGNEND